MINVGSSTRNIGTLIRNVCVFNMYIDTSTRYTVNLTRHVGSLTAARTHNILSMTPLLTLEVRVFFTRIPVTGSFRTLAIRLPKSLGLETTITEAIHLTCTVERFGY